MKCLKLVVLSLITQFALVHTAQAKETILTISDQVVDLTVELNPKTVLCLIGDYSASSFKIAIPAIKHYTRLDHTSRGAPGPCINAGRCNGKWGRTDSRLSEFHDVNKPTEDIKLRVIAEEVITFVSANQCVRVYRERLSSIIRGVPFYHEASLQLADVSLETCNALASGGHSE